MPRGGEVGRQQPGGAELKPGSAPRYLSPWQLPCILIRAVFVSRLRLYFLAGKQTL